jgi:hypothetical protein
LEAFNSLGNITLLLNQIEPERYQAALERGLTAQFDRLVAEILRNDPVAASGGSMLC